MEDSNSRKGKTNGRNKKIIITFIIVVIFIASNLTFFYIGNVFAFSGIRLKSISTNVAKDLENVKDVEKYDLLFQVRESLLTKYDGEIDDQKLLEAAIKGMTASLKDPYTVFMNSNEYKSFVEQSEGHFVGIGAQLGMKDGRITVVAPIDGSPAEKAGLLAGDIIKKVDGNELVEANVEKTVSMIKGEKGKPVTLTIERNNEKTFDVTITRDEIKMVSVKGEILDNSVGYIQIASFDEYVAKDFKNKIVELKEKGMKGMILDLRGNPGGFLGEAVKVASQFIPKGKVVTYTIDKYENKLESKSVGGEAEDMPLVVLIDGGSASASEVVTGALRDYGVATTVGVTSFGKGVVQQLVEYKDRNGGLKVTTSKYYTPNGENIHKKGIKPDIEVNIPKDQLEKPYNRAEDPQLNKGLEVIKEKLK
ncbi:S41 family peptidase [Clostridium carnis]